MQQLYILKYIIPHVFKFIYNERCLVPPTPEVIAEAKRLFVKAKEQNPNINKLDFLKSIGLGAGNPREKISLQR